MEGHPASTARALSTPGAGNRQLVPTRLAPHHLAEARHVERLRRHRRLPPRRIFALLLRLVLTARLALTILVAALPVFAVRHGRTSGRPEAPRRRRADYTANSCCRKTEGTEGTERASKTETRRNGGERNGTPANDAVQPMPPRVRGGRSTDAPWAQAACGGSAACARGASVDRSARPMAGPASALNAEFQ